MRRVSIPRGNGLVEEDMAVLSKPAVRPVRHCFTALLALLLAMLLPTGAWAAPQPSNITSTTYVVMDATTGQVIVQRDMHKRVYPASTTKVVTAAIALALTRPTDELIVSARAVNLPYDSMVIYLAAGEKLTMRDALYGLMLMSGNDAANVIAEHVSGSLEDFATLMNQTAAGVGATGTHFTNAHGLPEAEHYTTPYDMALLTRYALNLPGFRELFGAVSYRMPATNVRGVRNFGTYHSMMDKTSGYYYPNATGGKIGWTSQAGNTAVTLAQKDGIELICTVFGLRSSGHRYQDSINLFDFVFDNFEYVTVDPHSLVLEDIEDAPLYLEGPVTFLVPKGTTSADIEVRHQLSQEASQADRLGFYLQGQEVFSTPVSLYAQAKRAEQLAAEKAAEQAAQQPNLSFGVLVLLMCGVMVFSVKSFFTSRNAMRGRTKRPPNKRQTRRRRRYDT